MRKSFLISIIGEALPDDWVVKNVPANAGDAERNSGSISGSGRSPGGGNGNPLQYFCLGKIQRVAKNSDWTCMHVMSFDHCIQPYRHFLKVPSQSLFNWFLLHLTPIDPTLSDFCSYSFPSSRAAYKWDPITLPICVWLSSLTVVFWRSIIHVNIGSVVCSFLLYFVVHLFLWRFYFFWNLQGQCWTFPEDFAFCS